MYVTEPVAEGTGCSYQSKRYRSEEDVSVYLCNRECVSVTACSIPPGLVCYLKENQTYLQSRFCSQEQANVNVRWCSPSTEHWLPIHELGIPRSKRYVCVCFCPSRTTWLRMRQEILDSIVLIHWPVRFVT